MTASANGPQHDLKVMTHAKAAYRRRTDAEARLTSSAPRLARVAALARHVLRGGRP